jgi:hypothetical protein
LGRQHSLECYRWFVGCGTASEQWSWFSELFPLHGEQGRIMQSLEDDTSWERLVLHLQWLSVVQWPVLWIDCVSDRFNVAMFVLAVPRHLRNTSKMSNCCTTIISRTGSARHKAWKSTCMHFDFRVGGDHIMCKTFN